MRRVAVADADAATTLRRSLPGMRLRGVEVWSGPDAATELTAAAGADVVLNAITGSVGLGPTLAALRGRRRRWRWPTRSRWSPGVRWSPARPRPGQIVPVDSEHSALAQCLRGGRAEEVDRLVLTASGGPFRGRRRDELAAVTVDEALAHPTWDMGPVVTINSATLINKGLELIEAHLLFGVPYERIDVVVHPQSIVHSMVTFADGSTLAQASPPDMTLPIALALAWPDRVPGRGRAVPLGRRAELDLRAARRRRVPRRPAGPGRRHGRWLPARRAERGQRGGGGRVRRPARCRSPASPTCSSGCWTRPTAGRAIRLPWRTCSPRRNGRGPARASSRSDRE